VVGYELCGGEGEEAGTALWRPLEAGSGRAVFAWRAVNARPMIVGVPHPWFEDGTLQQGVYAFGELNARALIAAGTHRCANTAPGPCDSAVGVCAGEPLPPPESDQAHVSESVFNVAHELFSDGFAEDVVVSLHGMAGDGVSISNGTFDDVAANSEVAVVAALLATEFPGEYVSTCNAYDGATVEARQCGTANVQGRYVNGSSGPCEGAQSGGGRFIHLEQSRDILDEGARVMEILDAAID
jgi:hypothetical protein